MYSAETNLAEEKVNQSTKDNNLTDITRCLKPYKANSLLALESNKAHEDQHVPLQI